MFNSLYHLKNQACYCFLQTFLRYLATMLLISLVIIVVGSGSGSVLKAKLMNAYFMNYRLT